MANGNGRITVFPTDEDKSMTQWRDFPDMYIDASTLASVLDEIEPHCPGLLFEVDAAVAATPGFLECFMKSVGTAFFLLVLAKTVCDRSVFEGNLAKLRYWMDWHPLVVKTVWTVLRVDRCHEDVMDHLIPPGELEVRRSFLEACVAGAWPAPPAVIQSYTSNLRVETGNVAGL